MGFWSGLIVGIICGTAGLVTLMFSARWLLDKLDPPMGPGPPAKEIARDPQLDIELHPNDVPEELRELVPVARKFGVGCDGLRSEVIEAASPHEKAELLALMKTHRHIVQKWIDYAGGGSMPEWLVPMMYALIAAEGIDLSTLELPFKRESRCPEDTGSVT